jgi:hypothetical protein
VVNRDFRDLPVGSLCDWWIRYANATFLRGRRRHSNRHFGVLPPVKRSNNLARVVHVQETGGTIPTRRTIEVATWFRMAEYWKLSLLFNVKVEQRVRRAKLKSSMILGQDWSSLRHTRACANHTHIARLARRATKAIVRNQAW